MPSMIWSTFVKPALASRLTARACGRRSGHDHDRSRSQTATFSSETRGGCVSAMMIFGGEARQRTEQEYNELFAATGFSPTRGVGTGTAFSILEAKPN